MGHLLCVVREIENVMREEGLKGMDLFSQMTESVVSFFDCLISGYREGRARLL